MTQMVAFLHIHLSQGYSDHSGQHYYIFIPPTDTQTILVNMVTLPLMLKSCSSKAGPESCPPLPLLSLPESSVLHYKHDLVLAFLLIYQQPVHTFKKCIFDASFNYCLFYYLNLQYFYFHFKDGQQD